MEKDWVSVYSTNQTHLAELAKMHLAENSIEAVILNQMDTFYHFGALEVFVKAENVIRAKHILKNLE